ncbi:MAG: RagB/SusD family nutrient uptake outer membrane protein [Bacteroidetes bacterium]|uniref:RagB/SusD family nutrient uptake outer membrane protein n=1 Tax=Candidatus Cryptobacteroides excrementipullorum TaxID=2840761 RepID=A0A9D9IUW3_9BACT|nr:RagB/SusD family nutrient uptake outer membrane protein [Candidatus Cryptobacteroides excrementipullorum]
MNRNTIYRLLLFLAVPLYSISCNDDFLERYPEGEVTEATAFTSYTTSYSYCRSLYAIFDGQTYFPGPTMVSGALGTSTTDIYSGILTNYGNGGGTVNNPYADNRVTIPTTKDGTYYNPYFYIRMANIMLEHLQEPECDDLERLHLEAIARFFRAYCHFGLLVNYGDVIYVDHVLNDDSPELTAARDSRLYVADQIYDELEWCAEAFASIEAGNAGLIPDNTVNEDVTLALMSRFALFEGTWRHYHSVDESECAANGYVTGTDLLNKCVEVSQTLMDRYPTLYTGTYEGYPGQGWGQLWTTEDLSGVPGVIMYMKYTEEYKMHRLGHFEHIGSASLEMPQSTVDLYLTKDGLPIHNASVKYYDYTGTGTEYVEAAEPYDYANCDIYKTFRNRDPRMWQTVMPPYHVFRTGGSNDYAYDDRFDGKFREYLNWFPARGVQTGEYYTSGEGEELEIYRLPAINTGYHLINYHKALPSGNWGGNIQNNVPNTKLGTNNEAIVDAGEIMYASNTAYQKGMSGYFVWKHHACWDKQDQNYAMEISDKPMFKVEEAMLNYIEAKYVLNGTVSQTDVDATINKLRDRAEVGRMNLGDITDSFDPDRNPEIDPVLWEIRRERLIELMGEGFSWFDIRRWKQGPWYVNKQHYGVYVENATASKINSQSYGETGILVEGGTTEASSSQLASQGGGGHLYYYASPASSTGWQDKYYLYPISTFDTQLNPNLGNNPGW